MWKLEEDAYTARVMLSRSIRTLCFVLPLFLSTFLFAAESDSVRIEIKSSWGGLGVPTTGNLVITGKHGNYGSADRKINVRAVDSLLPH